MGTLLIKVVSGIANAHLITHAVKLVGKFIKAVAHSNFGLVGLDRVASWLGLG